MISQYLPGSEYCSVDQEGRWDRGVVQRLSNRFQTYAEGMTVDLNGTTLDQNVSGSSSLLQDLKRHLANLDSS
jgi:hypothetical protein